MLYKTIALELVKERPRLYEDLRRQRQVLATIDRLAQELKASYETWKARLAQARPGSDPSQLASEAGELALQELADSLPPGAD